MKTWTILFSIVALIALIATIAGRYHQFFIFLLAGAMAGICHFTWQEEKDKSQNIWRK